MSGGVEGWRNGRVEEWERVEKKGHYALTQDRADKVCPHETSVVGTRVDHLLQPYAELRGCQLVLSPAAEQSVRACNVHCKRMLGHRRFHKKGARKSGKNVCKHATVEM